MSGCMMKGCCHPLNFEGRQKRRRWRRRRRRRRRRWRWVTCRRDSFGWVSMAVGGRWRGVLVPDPCLSGAAVFTVRKEAVNSVCSHLSKTEQLLTPPPPPPPPTNTETRGDPSGVYFLGGRKAKKQKWHREGERPSCSVFLGGRKKKKKKKKIAREGVFLWLCSVCSGESVRPESDGPPPQGPGGDWQAFLLEV